MTWRVDFTGVEESNFMEFPDGDHIVEVSGDVTQEPGQEYPYLKFPLKGLSGAGKDCTINHICTLKPEGLFNLRNTLQALGFNIPKAAVNINPAQLKKRRMLITTGDSTRRFKKDGTPFKEVKKVRPVPAAGTPTTAPAADMSTMVITDGDL